MDGIRCTFINNLNTSFYGLYSRAGNKLIGFDHIILELRELKDNINLNFDLIDGELYSHEIPFHQIQGIVLSNVNYNKEDKEKLKFNIFAIDGENINNTTQMLQALDEIANVINKLELCFIEVVPCESVRNNKENIIKLAEKYVKLGYEGLMLRNPDVNYINKRSDDLVKFKFFIEDDFTVVDFLEGQEGTQFEGSLGAVIVEGKINDKKIRTEVGSGFKVYERDYIWQNKDKFLNKKCEVKFQSVGLVDNNGSYSLIFPVFKKFKLDR